MNHSEKNKIIQEHCRKNRVNGCDKCIIEPICAPIGGTFPYNEDACDKALDIIHGVDINHPDDTYDNVNHPAHYTDGKIEVIDFIEDKKLGFHLGNAVKYIARAGKKDPTKEVEDLKKADWYINRRIKELEEAK